MENTGNKKALIKMANTLDNEQKYEKYYAFAVSYVKNLIYRNNSSCDSLFKLMKDLKNSKNEYKYKTLLGISGNYNSGEINSWAQNILNKEGVLRKYSLEEIGYIMSVCRINCKINKEDVDDKKSYKGAEFSVSENNKKAKEKKYYFECKNPKCKEKNYIKEKGVFDEKRECSKCKKKYSYSVKYDIKEE